MAVQSLRTLPFARGLVLVLVQLYQSWSATASGKTLCTPRRIPDERLPRQLQFLIYHRMFADKHVHRYTVQHLPGLETRAGSMGSGRLSTTSRCSTRATLSCAANPPRPPTLGPPIRAIKRGHVEAFPIASAARATALHPPSTVQRRLVPRPPPLLCTADAPRSIHGPPKPAGRFGPGRRVALRQGVHAVDEW
jgi:hypothetical protein